MNRCLTSSEVGERPVENVENKQDNSRGGAKEGFVDVRASKNNSGSNGNNERNTQGNFVGKKRVRAKNNDNNVKFVYKPKVHNRNISVKQVKAAKTNGVNSRNNNEVNKKQYYTLKIWNVGRDNVDALKRSANKYVVLS
ncbi:hypothetical protein Tco_1516094 [Tanacetum coccineum]